MTRDRRRIVWRSVTFLTEWEAFHRRVNRSIQRKGEPHMMIGLREMSPEEYREWRARQAERRPA